jgi:FtsK/SpoIIIE family
VLTAGQTGSGKSVFLKTLVCTIAMCCDPDGVRLVLVDGKGLDLTIFDKLPHSACKVITDPTAAFQALRWLYKEMMRRHQILRAAGFTDLWMHRAATRAHDSLRPSPPAIVVVIDEVQMLTQDDRKQGEELVRALCQQGRACGIVLVLATQRPSADILQGSIKANMASRISFRLPSQVDSRVILGQPGAERLVGPGSMIALSPSRSGASRLHAPLVQDDEIGRICVWLSEKYKSKPVSSLEQLRRTVSECHRIDASPDGATDKINRSDAQDVPCRSRLTPRFVRILADRKKLERRIANNYPDHDFSIALRYLPCVLMVLRGAWRRRQVLFALDSGAFITSMTPFQAVPLWSRLIEHGDAERLATLITGRHKPRAEGGADDESFWRMVGRGLLAVGKNGFRVASNLTRVPVLQGRLRLDLVPAKIGTSWPPPEQIEARVVRLRREVAQLWKLNTEKQTLVGLPAYEVDLCADVRALIAAWSHLREDVGIEDLVLDDMLGHVAMPSKLERR